ncbi:hypothetical protein HGR_07556 [Hylemonella gracilis ATCC 19624]|uniref:DUF2946 domain-containing protein n=1 Tax=Hylemonella gracilis ATCC 19624 TaxID=887062 RepID=F3KST2_9BURK|nr:hypothetical protein HGR_07556 [Hylemonella gracilis ATCC 19624]
MTLDLAVNPLQRLGPAWRRVLLGLVLLLPLAQWGAVLHGLEHDVQASAHLTDSADPFDPANPANGADSHGPDSSAAHACGTCLAYASLGVLGLHGLLAAPLISGLAFGLAVLVPCLIPRLAVVRARNRGPPALG